MNVWARRTVVALSLLILGAGAAAAAPLGTGFTYQGQLNQSGTPVTGVAHFRFSLWDALSAGTQVGAYQVVSNVVVTGGVFTVTLNQSEQFGSSAFNGNARWLQIEVCTDAGCGTRTVLTPRQPLTGSPYALQSSQTKALTNLEGGGVAIQINPDTKTNSAGIFSGRLHNDLIAGSYMDGGLSHGFISSGYAGSARKISLGRANSSDFTAAVFQPQLTIVTGTGNVGIGSASPTTKLDVRGDLALEAGRNPYLYTGATGVASGHRFLELLHDPAAQSASGLKAGGLLVADDYNYADPGSNDLVVKGRVGIGTSTPADKLHVTGGRVRIENELAAAGPENLRIIRGSIFGNGNIQHGSGFTVSDGPGTGRFTITFNVPFAGAPTIVATPNYCAGCFVTIVQVESVSSTAAVVSAVYRHDGSYAPTAGPLSFVAVGPR